MLYIVIIDGRTVKGRKTLAQAKRLTAGKTCYEIIRPNGTVYDIKMEGWTLVEVEAPKELPVYSLKSITRK